MSKLIPIGDNIIAKAIEENDKVTASGIIIPETAIKEKPGKAEVVNAKLETGFKVGDIILFTKYSPTEITVDNEDFLILAVEDIFAKLDDAENGSEGKE